MVRLRRDKRLVYGIFYHAERKRYEQHVGQYRTERVIIRNHLLLPDQDAERCRVFDWKRGVVYHLKFRWRRRTGKRETNH